MRKLQIILGIILFLAIGSIFIFSQTTQRVGFIGISPTPTIDLSQPFQVKNNNANQTQQTQQVQAAQNQQPIIPTPTEVQIPQIPLAASISAVIQTSKGAIDISLDGKNAPNTVRNFITKAQNNFYNNLTFHRVEDWVIQGGDPNGDGTGGGNMPVEFNSNPFVTGSVGMASTGNGTTQNASQFFIMKTDGNWLNGKYTNFGTVTNGMDVVNSIVVGDKILSITIDNPTPSNTVQSEGGIPENP